jgi:hypothetical protein
LAKGKRPRGNGQGETAKGKHAVTAASAFHASIKRYYKTSFIVVKP